MDTTGLMIDAVELRRRFKDIQAVSGVSFRVHHGEIFGLLGPNGAGKTTTIRLLSGQIDPTGGRAVVAGCDVVKDRSRLKERIGVVFEEQNLYERLSAANNLQFNCWLYGLPESRIDEVLDLVHLRQRAKDPVRTFRPRQPILGLFFGSVFNTASAAGTVAGFVAIVYILGGLFVGPLGQMLGGGLVVQIARLLPTYYLAEGAINASQNLGSLSSNLLDTGVILGSTLVLLAISTWELRRQAAVLATV